MGFNTVAFMLNDMMPSIEKSPVTVAWGLSHPPMSNNKNALALWHDHMRKIADSNGEPPVHFQALEVLGTFHADQTKIIAFGGNYYTILHETVGVGHHNEESQVKLLKEWADKLGYRVSKKPQRKTDILVEVKE